MTYQFRGFTLPQETKDDIDVFVEHGIPPVGWLEAVLSDRFTAAALQADEKNAAALVAIAAYLHWEIPSACWGSRDKVADWCNRKYQERAAVCRRG